VTTASRIEQLCIENGLKMTGQRRVIARVLSDSDDHPDVEELYRRAAAMDSRISIATVYRTVRLLEEKGILERRDFGGGRARYDTTHGRHYHLIDIDTGKVIEFEDEASARQADEIARRLGFELVNVRLEIYGRKAVRKPPSAETDGRRSDQHPGDASSVQPAREPRRGSPQRAGGSGPFSPAHTAPERR